MQVAVERWMQMEQELSPGSEQLQVITVIFSSRQRYSQSNRHIICLWILKLFLS